MRRHRRQDTFDAPTSHDRRLAACATHTSQHNRCACSVECGCCAAYCPREATYPMRWTGYAGHRSHGLASLTPPHAPPSPPRYVRRPQQPMLQPCPLRATTRGSNVVGRACGRHLQGADKRLATHIAVHQQAHRQETSSGSTALCSRSLARPRAPHAQPSPPLCVRHPQQSRSPPSRLCHAQVAEPSLRTCVNMPWGLGMRRLLRPSGDIP